MDKPSRTSFESKRDALKEISGVSEEDQDIQANKETFKAGENNIQQNIQTGLKNQKDVLEIAKKEMHQDFQESDDESIA
jgi:fructose-specific phosphotransferase system component IIB